VTNEELDRVVSRRVDRPTAATTEDERAYRAAEGAPSTIDTDTDSGGTGGAAERAARSTETDDGEPTRSE
jgi:hypothetical protein